MILVDSSTWIEFLRRTGSSERLRDDLGRPGLLATTEPVVMELVAGTRTRKNELEVRALLATCEFISLAGLGDWESAAALYKTCRRGGVTPRRLVDCLIAAVAIRNEVPILAQDRDFELIAEHTSLELAA